MTITSAIVLYVVIWFLTMFVTLPIGLRTQGDEDEVVPGTQPGAPANFRLKRTLIIVTGVGTVIWLLSVLVILSGWITLQNLDMLHFLD